MPNEFHKYFKFLDNPKVNWWVVDTGTMVDGVYVVDGVEVVVESFCGFKDIVVFQEWLNGNIQKFRVHLSRVLRSSNDLVEKRFHCIEVASFVSEYAKQLETKNGRYYLKYLMSNQIDVPVPEYGGVIDQFYLQDYLSVIDRFLQKCRVLCDPALIDEVVSGPSRETTLQPIEGALEKRLTHPPIKKHSFKIAEEFKHGMIGLFNKLIQEKFIDPNTTLSDFIKAFNSDLNGSLKHIRWIKKEKNGTGTLYLDFFIQSLMEKKIIANLTSQARNKAISKIFVDYKGQTFKHLPQARNQNKRTEGLGKVNDVNWKLEMIIDNAFDLKKNE